MDDPLGDFLNDIQQLPGSSNAYFGADDNKEKDDNKQQGNSKQIGNNQIGQKESQSQDKSNPQINEQMTTLQQQENEKQGQNINNNNQAAPRQVNNEKQEQKQQKIIEQRKQQYRQQQQKQQGQQQQQLQDYQQQQQHQQKQQQENQQQTQQQQQVQQGKQQQQEILQQQQRQQIYQYDVNNSNKQQVESTIGIDQTENSTKQPQQQQQSIKQQDNQTYEIDDIKEVQQQLKEYYEQMKQKGQPTGLEDNQIQEQDSNLLESKPEVSNNLAEALLQNFLRETREVDRDNEVNRILWAFKINPYEQLDIRFDASLEEVPRPDLGLRKMQKQIALSRFQQAFTSQDLLVQICQFLFRGKILQEIRAEVQWLYRKLSLLVHPDKCKHPNAKEAFETLGKALKLIQDDERRETLFIILDKAKKVTVEDKRRETKFDAGLRLQAQMHRDGLNGVIQEWEGSHEFHEKWKSKSREMLARAEYRKMKLTNRIVEEEERIKQEDDDVRKKYEEDKQAHKAWEKTREERVNTWRSYQSKGGPKFGLQFKTPKQKIADEDKLYVQRARKFDDFESEGQGQQVNQQQKNKKNKKK